MKAALLGIGFVTVAALPDLKFGVLVRHRVR
jgi:hypothetical protein